MANCYLKFTYFLFVLLFAFVQKIQCNFVINNKSEILNIINYLHELQQFEVNNYENNINKLKSTKYNNVTCVIDLINIFQGLNNTELWALKGN